MRKPIAYARHRLAKRRLQPLFNLGQEFMKYRLRIVAWLVASEHFDQARAAARGIVEERGLGAFHAAEDGQNQ